MKRSSSIAVRHPVLVLVVWAILAGALSIHGVGFDSRLSSTTFELPGSSSAKAQDVADRYFGTQASMPVLLEGPRAHVERQGRGLVKRLRAMPGTQVLSPWDGGRLVPELRPRAGRALILVLADSNNVVDDRPGRVVRRVVESHVAAPVRASVSGYPSTSGALKDTSLSAVRQAERIAIPILFVVLLLVFRSPLAALLSAAFGIAAVEASYGAVSLLTDLHPVSDIAASLTSMMGLALGVDYTLLLVSRFREELQAGRGPREAALAAQGSAGRTVIFAGLTLVIAMAAAIALSPGDFLFSAAASVATVAVISVAGAYLAAPAALVLLGRRIDLWRFGSPPREGGRWAGLAEAVQRRPVRWGAFALVFLAGLCVPALGLDTGPPDIKTLPASNPARQDFERVAEVVGDGWAAPFEVYVADSTGPITTRKRLRALERWQRRVARWPGVATVVGPGVIASQQPGLLRADRDATRAQRSLNRGRRNARTLSGGLDRASTGASSIGSGLSRASGAADRLGRGADQGGRAAERLSGGIGSARGGARRLVDGTRRARDGTARLADGIGRSQSGARTLAQGLARTTDPARKLEAGARNLGGNLRSGQGDLVRLAQRSGTAQQDSQALLAAIQQMSVGKTDPQYRAVIERAGALAAFISGRDPRSGAQIDPAYPGLPGAINRAGGQLGQAAQGADRLRTGAGGLATGLGKLSVGAGQLTSGLSTAGAGGAAVEDGLDRAQRRAAALPAGLSMIEGGTQRLGRGFGTLHSGTGELADGLRGGETRSRELGNALGRASRRSAASARNANAGPLADARQRSPRLLDSGYFVLAALDGARQGPRTQSGYAVNLRRGGSAARITVVPTRGANTELSHRLNDRLRASMPALARDIDAQAVTGGVAAQSADYQRVLGARLPILILVLSAVSALVLIALLRAVLLPLISVALNVLTVGAAFGVVALCFDGAPPLLGGPGFADILGLLATFTVVFALSLDYQVFILSRMRESWLDVGELQPAVTRTIDRTARVVTGAAAIMGGVFLAFTTAELTVVRQSGVGLATAVLIDATLVRLVLLPAAMKLAGPRVFWMPRWLDRLLPNLDVEGTVSGPSARRTPASAAAPLEPSSG